MEMIRRPVECPSRSKTTSIGAQHTGKAERNGKTLNADQTNDFTIEDGKIVRIDETNDDQATQDVFWAEEADSRLR